VTFLGHVFAMSCEKIKKRSMLGRRKLIVFPAPVLARTTRSCPQETWLAGQHTMEIDDRSMKKNTYREFVLSIREPFFCQKNDDSNLNSFAPFRLRCHQISSDHNGKILVPATSNCPKSPRPFPQRWVGRSAAEHPETRNFGH